MLLYNSLDIVERNTNVIIVIISRHGHIDGRLIDPRILRQLAVLLEVTRLVGGVLVHDVDLLVLEVTLAHQDDVTGRDPHLLPHLAADVSQPRHTIEAEAFAAAVAQHLHDLRVFLSILLEFQFAFAFLSVALSSSSVLATLSCLSRTSHHVVSMIVIIIWFEDGRGER